MTTEEINFKLLQAFAADLANGKHSVEPALDPDLGFIMLAYKDYTGVVQKVLAKNQAAYVKSLRINDFAGSNGLLHHDSAGDIEGGQVTIAELNSFISDDTLISNTTFNDYTVLVADIDDSPFQLTLAPSTVLGRESTGGIVALDAAALKGIAQVSMQDTYDVSGSIILADSQALNVSGDGIDMINASWEDKGETTDVNLTLNAKITSVSGNTLLLKDGYLSSDVSLSESGETALTTVSQSIIGAINELNYIPGTSEYLVLTGAIDGVNQTYTLNKAPSDWSKVKFYINGKLRQPGVDFSGVGNVLTVAFPPAASTESLLLTSPSAEAVQDLPVVQVVSTATATISGETEIVNVTYASTCTLTIATTFIAGSGRALEIIDTVAGRSASNYIDAVGEANEPINGNPNGLRIVTNGTNNDGACVQLRMLGNEMKIVGGAL